MINIVHAWNFMYENDHSYELLLFMYDILNHGYERLLIMDDQYWSVHHIMTPSWLVPEGEAKDLPQLSQALQEQGLQLQVEILWPENWILLLNLL